MTAGDSRENLDIEAAVPPSFGMVALRREPRSEGSKDAAAGLVTADLVTADPPTAAAGERCDEYGDARELATTWAEHGDVDRGGWCRSHWAD